MREGRSLMKKGRSTLLPGRLAGRVFLGEVKLLMGRLPLRGREGTRSAARVDEKREKVKVVPKGRGHEAALSRGGTNGQIKPAKKGGVPLPSKRAAVYVMVPERGGVTYAEALRSARERTSLANLGVSEVRSRRAITGSLIMEIPGKSSDEKANRLAALMRDALADKGVRAARPSKRAEMRVGGLDDSATPGEAAIAEVGGCAVGDIKIGEILMFPNGMGIVWAQCPVALAAVAKRVKVRPLRCYRYLDVGYVRAWCTVPFDRSGRFYRCGECGYRANLCLAA
ncbi:hypothetical protein DBV15_12905, partial [Temnothorax longispinosus]